MIRFEQVSKVYPDGTKAVDDLSFEVDEGELVTLVGPSGCGKTTTMMMVNRLIEPTSGRILVNGEDIAEVDPVRLRRRIGYVIQQVGLFPHRTILDNTATVPTLVGWKKAKARARAAELLDLVGLDPATYGSRYPEQLSGGQRQRVGVARALAADPPVLLMDEPFGAVDPVVREQLQDEFLSMQRSVRKTVLLVTHDIEEAVRLGDRIAVYGQGRIEQFDTPGAVLGTPATPYVAEFVGADRGLKRLSVTEIEADDLEQPPVARLDESAAEAAARLRGDGSRWAVVLDTDGDLHGWVGVDELGAGGLVGAYAHRMNSWVPVGAPLKQAFGVMLQHDAGWVAVLDGARFLGVLTPAKLHEALRRSVDADARGVPRGQVDFDSVADA
ncbi:MULTISPECIES: betaine/proline/choline family ABC transporter ATP-binding protein [unclassified Streptomyces]|uniref:betaine/proline/choline family ABC transporter ATP-binding protein n=1 Tax=unclassified Streptomyces TaxID=2593676 RepID=UPI00225A6F28|nr:MULTISPECIES: betaine/proline/choline family ABC transporter ATP-binding protein [unclassified Streptomyces]MCX4918393.1 betaine/proline/choline family ABC transporter ATP-binding protein [Streptomyces sp. NBC_00687]MCX5135385.1 betaine/proline/choline family ABC transporter ATP-binding protein [Streptomyces sp. NBC_00340]MCX5280491.1 betaine/proline/choline family ABC transporter ATP-binding protein [Streptomyces sp. NBC_00198]WSD76305.1 betaine/proline/choline family ABC transporter ATP-bi